MRGKKEKEKKSPSRESGAGVGAKKVNDRQSRGRPNYNTTVSSAIILKILKNPQVIIQV